MEKIINFINNATNWFLNLSQIFQYLIIGAAGALVLFIIVVIIVASVKNSSQTYKKQLKKISARLDLYNKNQVETYLNRLSKMADKNEELNPMYQELNSKFENLINGKVTSLDGEYKLLLAKLEKVNRVNKKLAKEAKEFENGVVGLEKESLQIQKEFEEFFAKADKLRVSLQQLQERYHEALEQIKNYESSLTLCKEALDTYMLSVEKKFEGLEELIQEAKFNDADKEFRITEKMIFNIYGNVEKIARYCKMVEEEIPNQLRSLKERNDELANNGYVVRFANVDEFISNSNKVLEQCKTDFSALNFGEFEEIANEFTKKINEVNSNLDQEVNSKGLLEAKYHHAFENITKAEKDFIKTKRQYQTLKEYYKLSEEIDERFVQFEKNATLLTSLKIEYDGFIFSNSNHPASFMLEKVNTLDELCETVVTDINYLSNYFVSVRNYVEDVYKKVIDLSVKLIKIVGEIRLNKCKDVYMKYIDKENEMLEKLKNISDVLTKKPIDVTTVQSLFNGTEIEARNLIVSMQNDLANYQTVEKSIIFANALRHQFKEVDTLLKEIEQSFKHGMYKDAQDKLNFIFNNYHPVAFDTFKE